MTPISTALSKDTWEELVLVLDQSISIQVNIGEEVEDAGCGEVNVSFTYLGLFHQLV